MTTDIKHISGHSKAAGCIKCTWELCKLSLNVFPRLSHIIHGRGPAVSWKVVMDRIAFGAMLLLALGLFLHPYLTGGVDPTAHPTASAKSLEIRTLKPHTAAPQAITVNPASLKDIHGKPGFWRLAETSTGVWWFLSPNNKPEFINSVTTVQPYQLGRDKGGIHYISRDFNGTPGGTGDLDQWAQKTVDRVLGMGFKGLGAWSNPVFHKFNVPMTQDLNVTTWLAPSARKLYYPEWSSSIEYAIQTQVVPLKDNTNLIGYFIDNELDWGDSASGPMHYFDGLSPADPNRREVVKVIQGVWTTLEEFNRDWHTNLKDWNELDGWQSLPQQQPQAYSRLFSAWLSHMSEDYFRITCGYIHKYDPNHLILGVRFRGYAPREVVRASRTFTDAQSINYYVSDARFDSEMFKMMTEESGQPVMVTEYSFHALDGRSGDRNTVGFASQVLDQQARADGYHLFTTRAARIPFIVGVDWFQWSDEPPNGRSSDGEDVNFGMVDVDDNPYELLAASVRDTAPMLDSDHADSATTSDEDVWRQSFANKPDMHVPFLTKPPYLNGELSDWPAESKMSGIQHSQTVGLERSRLPLPNVYLGWTDQGLYLAVEVFDDDIHGAPAKGWWWTRDYFEFWLSTHPVAKDQNNFDAGSNQFFFVPNAWPAEDGVLGTVGQWHRPGDALTDNLIPHPDIRAATRILPDRYVVEMFIPAKALHGFDPRHVSTLAFNIHARNFEHATDYFWSAPKEAMTQLRPNTWGTIELDPPANNLAQATNGLPATNLR
jgi:hypothetical protein